MSADRRTRRRRAHVAALVAALCAVVGGIGIATGAQAAPFLTGSTTSTATTTVDLGTLLFDGNGKRTTSIVGNGGRLVLTAGYSSHWSGVRAAPRLTLQRKVGAGSWRTTRAKVSLTDHGAVATTPAFSTKATTRTVEYRFRSAAVGGVRNTSTSQTVSIVYENQHRYTGLALKVYRVVRPYCGTTAVHVGSLEQGAGDYRTGGLVIRIAGVVRTYRVIDVRAVALHECSHERQWLGYGGTSAGWRDMEADADAAFADWTTPQAHPAYPVEKPDPAISPVEHAADCGAQSVNPGGYLGYGGYCTKAELAAGKRLLEGHRYPRGH